MNPPTSRTFELLANRTSGRILLLFAAGALLATLFLQGHGGVSTTTALLGIPAAVVFAAGAAFVLRQRGYRYAGTLVFMLLAYAAILNYVIAGKLGLHSYTPSFFLLIILAGAVFIGHRAVLATTAVSVVTVLVLYLMERQHFVINPEAVHAVPVVNILVAYVFLYCVGGGIAYAFSKGFSQVLLESEAKEQRFRQLFETAPLGFIMHRAGRVLMVNRAAAAAAGRDAQAMTGFSVTGFFPSEMSEVTQQRLVAAAALKFGEKFLLEYPYTDMRGRARLMETLTTPVGLADGPALLTMARDVTKERAAASAMAAAKEAAEAANQTKSQFLANMSHEIRTPMNAVLGLSELMLADDLSAAQRERADGIRSSAKALLNVINDVLDVARIEAGKTGLVEMLFEPRALLEEVRVMLQLMAREKGLVLEAHVNGAVPAVLRGDAGKVRQILINLGGNAVKFTAAGRVAMEISLAQSAPATPPNTVWLNCRVTDSGEGIASEHMSALFERFTQADESNTRAHGGTGLGLYIARQFALMMGGDISVKSVLGLGSTFEAQIGVGRAEPAGASPVPYTPPDMQPAGSSREAALTAPRALTVLLVEDNDLNRLVARSMLEGAGHSIVEAVNGAEAVARLQREEFDCVLMDCQMPVMDGVEATQRIRRLEAAEVRQRTPIVALTANAMQGDRERYLAAGMDAFLAKPFETAELLALVAHMAKEGVAPGAKRGGSAEVSDQPPVFDASALEQLERLEADTPGLLRSMVSRFAAETPKLIDQVSTGTVASEVERAAHSLKSTCARFGAKRLAELARRAEQSARKGDVAAAQADGRLMQAAFVPFDAAFRAHASVAAALAEQAAGAPAM